MNTPLVTVLMPAYNAEKYIAEAIESILNQSFKDFEFLIIDDKSTDSTKDIIQNYANKDSRIKFLSNDENLKLSRTLNKGIELAKGKYIARVDADDISFPDRIEKQVEIMEENPSVGISGGTMIIISAEGKTIGARSYHLTDTKIRRKIFRYSPFCHPTVIIRKSVFEKAGLYSPRFNPAEDYELYFRLGLHCKFANLADNLIKYRVVSSSMTSSQIREMESKTVSARKLYYNSYNASIVDRIYTNLLYATVVFPIIPAQKKLWLFTLIRRFL